MAFSHCFAVLCAAQSVAGTVDSGQVSGLCCTWQVLTLHSSHQWGMPAPGACISRDKPPATWTVKAGGKPETLCTTVKGEILPGVVGRALAGRRRPAERVPGPLPWGSPASRWPCPPGSIKSHCLFRQPGPRIDSSAERAAHLFLPQSWLHHVHGGLEGRVPYSRVKLYRVT